MQESGANEVIYLAMFATTAFLIYLSSKCEGSLKLILVALGLTLPCALAGVRDETVGTDVLSYAKWMCASAQNTPFLDFLNSAADVAAIGWNIMTWLSVRAFGGMIGYQFAIEAFCIVPIYLVAKRLFVNQEWAVVLIWLLLWYAFSLNGMRQSVAMGFVVYSVVYVVERRPLPFCVCIIEGLLFHQTAIVGFFLYPFAMVVVYSDVVKKFFGRQKNTILALLLVAIFPILIVMGPSLVRWLSVLKDSYSYQISHLGANDVSVAGLYLMASILVIWFLAKDGIAKAERSGLRLSIDKGTLASSGILAAFHFLCATAVVGSLLWQLNYVASTLGRLGYYGSALVPLIGGLLSLCGKRTRRSFVSLILLALVYFVAMTLVLGKSGAYPYTSLILGIV